MNSIRWIIMCALISSLGINLALLIDRMSTWSPWAIPFVAAHAIVVYASARGLIAILGGEEI